MLGRSDRRLWRFFARILVGVIVAGIVYFALPWVAPRAWPARSWFLAICAGNLVGGLLGLWVLKLILKGLERLAGGRRPTGDSRSSVTSNR